MSTTTSPAVIAERIDIWVATLGEAAGPNYAFSQEPGRKYVKIVQEWNNSRSVHAFVDAATGEVYKPAGWAKPAAGVRYHLADDEGFQSLLHNSATPSSRFGGYLYVGGRA